MPRVTVSEIVIDCESPAEARELLAQWLCGQRDFLGSHPESATPAAESPAAAAELLAAEPIAPAPPPALLRVLPPAPRPDCRPFAELPADAQRQCRELLYSYLGRHSRPIRARQAGQLCGIQLRHLRAALDYPLFVRLRQAYVRRAEFQDVENTLAFRQLILAALAGGARSEAAVLRELLVPPDLAEQLLDHNCFLRDPRTGMLAAAPVSERSLAVGCRNDVQEALKIAGRPIKPATLAAQLGQSLDLILEATNHPWFDRTDAGFILTEYGKQPPCLVSLSRASSASCPVSQLSTAAI